jgi:putative sterol carrier protein
MLQQHDRLAVLDRARGNHLQRVCQGTFDHLYVFALGNITAAGGYLVVQPAKGPARA